MPELIHTIELTEAEMQMLIHAVTGFYNRCNNEGTKINPHQSALVINAFQKFRKAVTGIVGLGVSSIEGKEEELLKEITDGQDSGSNQKH